MGPVLGQDGMVETEPQDDESRVALQIDRGEHVYGNTRNLPRWGYPDGLPSHDPILTKGRQVWPVAKAKASAGRAPRRSIMGAGLHGTVRRLVLAEYPTFENVITVMGSMAYKLPPNDEYFVQNPETVKDHWRAGTPAAVAAAGGVDPPFSYTRVDGAGPSEVTNEGAAAAPGSDFEMAVDPSAHAS